MPLESILDPILNEGEEIYEYAVDAFGNRIKQEIDQEIFGTNEPTGQGPTASQTQTPDQAKPKIDISSWSNWLTIAIVVIVVIAGIAIITRK